MNKHDPPPSVSTTQVHDLIARVHLSNLASEDKLLISNLLDLLLAISHQAQLDHATINHLRALLFGQSSERRPSKKASSGSSDNTSSSDDASSSEPSSVDQDSSPTADPSPSCKASNTEQKQKLQEVQRESKGRGRGEKRKKEEEKETKIGKEVRWASGIPTLLHATDGLPFSQMFASSYTYRI